VTNVVLRHLAVKFPLLNLRLQLMSCHLAQISGSANQSEIPDIRSMEYFSEMFGLIRVVARMYESGLEESDVSTREITLPVDRGSANHHQTIFSRIISSL
jgi:hypothetical protein